VIADVQSVHQQRVGGQVMLEYARSRNPEWRCRQRRRRLRDRPAIVIGVGCMMECAAGIGIGGGGGGVGGGAVGCTIENLACCLSGGGGRYSAVRSLSVVRYISKSNIPPSRTSVQNCLTLHGFFHDDAAAAEAKEKSLSARIAVL
jgi:hypothetical protein